MKTGIVKMGINGEGIGYYQRKPVFIMGALKGEFVDITITENKGNYYIGKLNKVIEKADERVRPACRYQRDCGGCPLMITDYKHQLMIKKELLAEALKKYAGYNGRIEEVIASPQITEYRNKINLPVITREGKLVNAMYAAGSNHPVVIENCLLHEPRIEKVRTEVLKILNHHHMHSYDSKDKKGIRHLVIRGFEHVQVVLITGKDDINQKIIDDIMAMEEVNSLYQGINTVRNPVNMMPEKLNLLSGEKNVLLELNGYKLRMLPQSFFQLNRYQADTIYRMLEDMIPQKVRVIVEAYCGIGAISLYLHEKAERIIGVEIVKEAIENARENAQVNNVENAEFICGDAGEKIQSLSKREKIDVLVVDPPRSGLDEKMISAIRRSKIERLLYVSCNPATLAKNIRDLSDDYHVEKVLPVDMFPFTPHVESIALLKSIKRKVKKFIDI